MGRSWFITLVFLSVQSGSDRKRVSIKRDYRAFNGKNKRLFRKDWVSRFGSGSKEEMFGSPRKEGHFTSKKQEILLNIKD